MPGKSGRSEEYGIVILYYYQHVESSLDIRALKILERYHPPLGPECSRSRNSGQVTIGKTPRNREIFDRMNFLWTIMCLMQLNTDRLTDATPSYPTGMGHIT